MFGMDSFLYSEADNRCQELKNKINDLQKEINKLKQTNTAEWIDNIDTVWETHELRHLYRCSKCEMYFSEQTNFCPNCGSRMTGEMQTDMAEWKIDKHNRVAQCSFCKKISPYDYGDYCKWCGAKMKGENQ
ncbi:MAG: hypothetical protein J5725_00480 [Bacteroidales bacterium]|nr:hypothetical protein [Bacteroidales bacterium]